LQAALVARGARSPDAAQRGDDPSHKQKGIYPLTEQAFQGVGSFVNFVIQSIYFKIMREKSMKIGIAVDNTIPLHLPSFFAFVRAHCKTLECNAIDVPLRFLNAEIECDAEIANLSSAFRKATKGNDVSILVTTIPFANNSFYEGRHDIYIVSLSDWHLLTTLPMSNGLALMLCQIVSEDYLHIGKSHDKNKGCINDFYWDKTGIDIGMRAAFVCDECMAFSADNRNLTSDKFADVVSMLNAISLASRRGVDILSEGTSSQSMPQPEASERFDAFLCHNSDDKPAVRILNEALKNGGIKTWLDDDQIMPGDVWQDKLENAIPSVAACLVIVGNSGFGPWQDMERRAFISEFANRGCKILPVLIGSETTPPQLPLFLKQFMWSDLRDDDGRQLAKIISALRR
jgi:hypothetical protein